eukprot:scaffold51798_cov57-Attheya_sp.AAC.2
MGKGQQELVQVIPDKFRRLKKILEDNKWRVDRISGSHYIFVKPGQRSIPLAFHGGSVTRRYAAMILRQAEIRVTDDDEIFNTEEPTTDDIVTETSMMQNICIHEGGEIASNAFIKPVPASKKLTKLGAYDALQWKMQREKEVKDAKKEEQRQKELLELIQNQIATGSYTDAIDTIDGEEIEFVGTSDRHYEFSSDLMFYKLAAMEECAFSEHSFNSKEQRELILDTLKLSRKYMQERIIQAYLDGAKQAFTKYTSAVLKGSKLNALSSLFLAQHEEEVQTRPTQEFVYGQLDTIIECMRFIVLIYEFVKEQPFRPEHDLLKCIEALEFSSMVFPCIRRMLILFDMEDFDSALSIAEMLLFVVANFHHSLDLHDMTLLALFSSTGKTAQIAKCVAQHVNALAPVYRSAKHEMKWSRWAGVFARKIETDNDVEINTISERCDYDISGTLKFTDMWIDAMKKSEDTIKALVVNNSTKTFMFDSFLDPISLIKNSVRCLFTDKRGMQFMKGFSDSACNDIDEYKFKSVTKLQHFQKGQFSRGVPGRLRGECKSSEEVLAEGIWSFDVVFSTMIPVFLLSFVFTNEMKRLHVIDGLGRNILKDRTDRQEVTRVVSQLGIDDGITCVASTALLLLNLILKLEVSTLSESFIRTSLRKITTAEAKSLEYRRWVKNKSKKYSKKIGQLKSSVMTQHSMLTLCIKSRDMAVNLLLEKFETSTLKRQRIPKDLVSRIDASTCRREQMLLVMQCIGHFANAAGDEAP